MFHTLKNLRKFAGKNNYMQIIRKMQPVNTASLQNRFISRTRILNENKEYTETDEWLYHTIDSTRIGLAKNAIDEMSDLVYIEYEHQKGDIVKENEDIVMIESVKATNSIVAPFDLIIIENNEELEESLEKVNTDPENVNESWFIKVDRLH